MKPTLSSVLTVVAFGALALSGCLGGAQDKEVNPAAPSGAVAKLAGKLPPVYTSTGELFEKDFADPDFPRVVQILVGKLGAEPNMGVTSKGGIFVTAFEDTMRSLDGGHTWESVYHFGSPVPPPGVNDPVQTADPMLWVDPDTDRIFTNHMFPVLLCTSNIISDDNGETWIPRHGACGIPVLDHQKLATGKYGPKLPALPTSNVYKNVVYLCYNKLISTNCAVSFDGGLNFPVDRVVSQNCAGVNGHPATAPDGTVYVPMGNDPFACGMPHVGVSEDNGLTWTDRFFGPKGEQIGVGDFDPEITVTPDGTAYYMGRGKDGREYLWRTKDKFATVEGPWVVSPPDVKGVVFAALMAGDNGRLAMAYLGNRESGGEPSGQMPNSDVKGVPKNATWHLFVTWSYDADQPTPTFTTQQVTPPDDPVQIGCVWLRGGGGGPERCRNLLDFIDGFLDKDGRVHIVFTDGCTARLACSGNAAATIKDSKDSAIAVAIQDHGPSLFESKGILPSLGWTTQINDPHNWGDKK